jgi:hypothetical protein
VLERAGDFTEALNPPQAVCGAPQLATVDLPALNDLNRHASRLEGGDLLLDAGEVDDDIAPEPVE